jgi:hypothetical protein
MQDDCRQGFSWEYLGRFADVGQVMACGFVLPSHHAASPTCGNAVAGESWSPGKAWHLFRAGARVTFFLKRKSPKKTLRSKSNLPSEAKPGFFDETSLSHRKTMHILCIALRVSNQGIAHCACSIVGAMTIYWRASDCSAVWIAVDRACASTCSVIALFRAFGNCLVPLTPKPPYCRAKIVDPEGGAQDVRRFSMRQGCLIEKSRLRFRSQV